MSRVRGLLQPGAPVTRASVPGWFEHAVEYVIVDVINYLSAGLKGDKLDLNMDRILKAATKVMPERKKLAEKDYFNRHMQEPDRHALLDKVFHDKPLL